jgi:hypothetical protein
MAQVVNRRPLTVEGLVRSQASPREICGGQCDTDTGLSPTTWLSPVRIISPMLYIHLHLYVALTRRRNGLSLGTCKKQRSYGSRGALDRKVFSLCRLKG